MIVELVGGGLVLLAALIPSSVWVYMLHTPPPGLRPQLLIGAVLFRIGLVVLGLFLFVGGRMGWWRLAKLNPAVVRRSFSRYEQIVLAGILAVALAARLYRLNQGLWLDEIDTLVHLARAPFGEIITTYKSQNQHFLYSLLAHASFLSFGESAWSLRLPAVLFGVGSIWALYLVAREVGDAQEATLSTALMAFSYHHVWFSQNARGYTGLLFWTLLSSWLYLRGLSEKTPHLWLYYAGALVLGIYTNMTMLFVAIGHFLSYLWILIVRRKEPWVGRWAPLISGYSLAALVSFQLHALTIPQILGPALADLSLVETWRNPLWTVREIVQGLHLGFGKGVGALFAFALLGAGSLSYLHRQPLVLHLLAIPVVLGAGVTLAIGHPLWPRFFFFSLGFVVLVVVRGVRALVEAVGRLLRWSDGTSTRLGVAAVVVMIVASAGTLAFAYRPKQDYSGARDFVNQVRQSSDAVVTAGVAAFVYKAYYAPEWETVGSVEELDAIRANNERTWLLYTLPLHMESYQPEILKVIERDSELVKAFPGSLNGGTVFVHRFDGRFQSPQGPGDDESQRLIQKLLGGC